MTELTLDDINLMELTWEREVPHDQLALLRREAPVFWHPLPEPGETGFWAVTKYHDVRAISLDLTTWSTERGTTFIRTPAPEFIKVARKMLAITDHPRHDRYRRLVNTGFTPRMVRKLAQTIQLMAEQIADAVIEKNGEVEFVTDVAKVLPLQMICEMVGVPESDHQMILDWSNRMVGHLDPDFIALHEDGADNRLEFFAYCDRLAADRREQPRDDIMTALVNAEVNGDRLTPDEIGAFFVNLSVAGDETNRHLISLAMLALIEHPEARAELAANIGDEQLWDRATEEFLRWGSAITAFRRTATRDAQIRGQRISEGDKVVIYYMSANRDEEIFADPYRFDIHRWPNNHVAFGGGGPHFCLGANLARLEIKFMIRELLRRYPDAELAGPYRRMRSDFINGIKEMPVRFGPA
jgi:cholest-4-en-3-one 26-monooxygenase